jgi:hypothetical protein
LSNNRKKKSVVRQSLVHLTTAFVSV